MSVQRMGKNEVRALTLHRLLSETLDGKPERVSTFTEIKKIAERERLRHSNPEIVRMLNVLVEKLLIDRVKGGYRVVLVPPFGITTYQRTVRIVTLQR